MFPLAVTGMLAFALMVFGLSVPASLRAASLAPAGSAPSEARPGRQALPLLASLTNVALHNAVVKDASVHWNAAQRSLTITFHYAAGEPEARLPVARLGWPTDWSAFKAVRLTFHSTSLEPVAIGFSDGERTRSFIVEPLSGVRIQGVIPFDAFVQMRSMTPLSPLGYKVWPERLFTFEKVQELVFRMKRLSQPAQLTLYEFTLTPDVPADAILDKRSLIDRYGQWIPENWEGKAHDDRQLAALWAADRAEPADFPFCPLGGDAERVIAEPGFFRTRRLEGRWVLVDPHGHAFYSAGMDLVGHTQDSFATEVSRREHLYAELPPPGPAWLRPGVVSFYVANVMKRFGEAWPRQWTAHILERLKSWGFNTIGNWSDEELAVSSGMPYVLPLHGWSTRKTFPFPYDFPDVFSDEFARNADAEARRLCAPRKDDPLLIGWFIGNEPHWARSFGAPRSWADTLLADPEASATQQELKRRLRERPAEAAAVKSDFLFECGRRYFETITRAVRRHDPNHLLLGIRFAERPDDRWARLSVLFDVFSINIYSDTFAPDRDMVRHYAELSGRPVLIGEFTAAAPGRGLQGLFYFVHKVRDQQERGTAYRYYVENAAADPYIIGTHWFQMVDDLPTGRPGDQERMNYGFIDVLDLPYAPLVQAARETHRRLYALKFGEAQPWRQPPRWH